MYTIKRCSEVPDSIIYQAFTDGFADYMIQVEMDETYFFKRFFGPEGNERELSFIALKDDQPVGICLGGYKTGEHVRTLRCGGLAIIASERRAGLGHRLMEKHEELGRDLGCKQLFLEVIQNNDPAVAFYQKLGYDLVYHLIYRTWVLKGQNPISLTGCQVEGPVEVLSHEALLAHRQAIDCHLPWQGEFDYLAHMDCGYYGILEDNELIAGCVASKERLYYIWVKPEKRLRGYGKTLIHRVIDDYKPDALRLIYANNSGLHTFANHYKMKKGSVNQYEMYKWLD